MRRTDYFPLEEVTTKTIGRTKFLWSCKISTTKFIIDTFPKHRFNFDFDHRFDTIIKGQQKKHIVSVILLTVIDILKTLHREFLGKN